MLRLAVLISGNGSNLQAILDATFDGRLEAKVVLVVSNRAGAYGLKRAEQAGIATHVATRAAAREAGLSRVEYDAQLAFVVADVNPDAVVLAGWMHVLSSAFLSRFPERVINLHPALPGMFPGVNAIERAWAASQRGELTSTGVMVHIAVEEVDAGPVLAQAEVPILASDTLEELEARMHPVEHRLLVDALARWS